MTPPRKIDLLQPEEATIAIGIIEGIERYVQQAGGWSINLYSNRLSHPLGFLQQTGGNGVIANVQSLSLERALRQLQRPVVNLFEDRPRQFFPSVVVDEETIGRMGADHFLERGYQRFAFFSTNKKQFRRREAAFSARLHDQGYGCLTTAPRGQPEIRPSWQEVDNLAFYRRWIRRLPPLTGVMVCNSAVARRLIEVCQQLGRNVPGEIAFLGVDNNLDSKYGEVPISAVDINLEQMGYEAAKMLHTLMEKRPLESTVVTIQPKGIVTRRSTDTLAIEDKDFAAALRFIRDHAREGIEVRNVLDAVPISRRMLERRFHDLMGHTPAEEIRRLRMEHARQLVLETDLSLLDIALRCGFHFPGHLSMAFRQAFGQTPRDYRKSHR